MALNDKLNVENFTDALLSADKTKASIILKSIYDEHKELLTIENLIVDSLNDIGKKWDIGKASLAQVYISGIITEELVLDILPSIALDLKTYPKIGIGVLLDHHGLGKTIVSTMVKANGYSLIDFGLGLTPEQIVDMAIKDSIDVLLISTLMLPSALQVKKVKELLVSKKSDIKVVVGGAPFRLDSNLWKKVNADDCCTSLSDIKSIIERVV